MVGSSVNMQTYARTAYFSWDLEILLLTILFGVLAASAITDFKWKRIPNAFTLPAMAVSMLIHGLNSGISGFIFSIEGLFLGMALLIIFYIMGMMGAGDVKLMGAVGSILGPAGVFKAFLFTAIVGGIYALVVLAFNGQLIDFMKRIARSMKLSLLTRGPTLVPHEGKATPVLCYGVAIALGTSLSTVF
jgi:prepilin peptidase CpaA